MNEITTGWDISRVTYYNEHEGYTNVINTVDWEYKAFYSGSEGVFHDIKNRGTSKFSLVSGSFIEYNDLSKNDVLDWVWSDIGAETKERIESDVYDKMIFELGCTTTGSFPWSE